MHIGMKNFVVFSALSSVDRPQVEHEHRLRANGRLIHTKAGRNECTHTIIFLCLSRQNKKLS
jgi:hypothetical protein